MIPAIPPSQRPRGFTLLELMVVLVILSLLTAIAAPRVTDYFRKAKQKAAQIQVEALSAAVESFLVDTGRLPTTADGLQSLLKAPTGLTSWDGPYIKKKESLLDPWGQPYGYRNPGKSAKFAVYTLGADHQEGGDGDARDISSE